MILPDNYYEIQARKKRLALRVSYLAWFLTTLAVEVLIALFVHDEFVRPYVGDILVVIVLYFFLKLIFINAGRFLPVYIFLFAAGVEALQYFQLADHLGLKSDSLLRIVLGSVFDAKDILCYGIGCLLIAGVPFFYKKLCRKRKGEKL